jgi:DNA-binding Lrp family transcriptional regulator
MIHHAPIRSSPHGGGPTRGSFSLGEPFDPHHDVCGFYPPDVVGRQRDLTDGQKRLYERAVRWAGQNGIFWYGFEKIAAELGKSLRQVKDDMAALEAKGLIRHTRRRRNSNVYSFLWHAMFEVQPTALQGDHKVRDSTLEVQDDVVLEVQSTAQESCQLESCKLNSVKADNKRIPGYASQEQRSAASCSVKEGEAPKNEPQKADGVPTSCQDQNLPAFENSSQAWTPRELAEVRGRIVAFWGREPEEGFEVSVMLRARGASAAAVCELLDRKFANRNCRVGGRHAPRNQNWFLTVLENEFEPGHLPEPPARPQNDHEAESEKMNRGIEAIELPDASRSIVESALCDRCGDQALVRYTDGAIEGCGCANNRRRGLDRIPASSVLGIQSTTAHRRSAGEGGT